MKNSEETSNRIYHLHQAWGGTAYNLAAAGAVWIYATSLPFRFSNRIRDGNASLSKSASGAGQQGRSQASACLTGSSTIITLIVASLATTCNSGSVNRFGYQG